MTYQDDEEQYKESERLHDVLARDILKLLLEGLVVTVGLCDVVDLLHLLGNVVGRASQCGQCSFGHGRLTMADTPDGRFWQEVGEADKGKGWRGQNC